MEIRQFLKKASPRFVPDLKFIAFFSGLSFFILTVLGAFGLSQTFFVKRFFLSLGYVVSDFVVFAGILIILRRIFATWNGQAWIAWGLLSVCLASPINLFLHDYSFNEGSFSVIRLLDMAYYITLLFLLASFSYGFLFEKDKKDEIKKLRLTIPADNPKNNLTLLIHNFLYAKSADNYLEVYFSGKGGGVEKKLVRSTIKKLAQHTDGRSDIIQCHQSYIVNLTRVLRVKGNVQHRLLVLDEEVEEIPVSRRFSKSTLEAFNQKSQNLTDYP